MVTFRLPANILSSHGRIPLWCANGLVWLQSRHPSRSTKLLKVSEDNYKVKYERSKGEAEVAAEWFHCSGWFSSIQLTFMGRTAAVKANQFSWNPVSVTCTYVLNRYMPIYLSSTDMPKSCPIYHVCSLIYSTRSTSRFIGMQNICLVSGGRCFAALWLFLRIT